MSHENEDQLRTQIKALIVDCDMLAAHCRSSRNTMSGRLVAAACHEAHAADLRSILAATEASR